MIGIVKNKFKNVGIMSFKKLAQFKLVHRSWNMYIYMCVSVYKRCRTQCYVAVRFMT